MFFVKFLLNVERIKLFSCQIEFFLSPPTLLDKGDL